MTFSIYEASVPVFTRQLRNLASVLEKGRANAEARTFAPDILVSARLAPDMHTLARQVQIAADTAKNCAARLGGVDAPSYPDTESTFEELQTRLSNTIAFIESVGQDKLAGSETKQITLKFPGRELTFSGADYLNLFALPNLYFHMTTTYNILRENGVPLGKADFMGA